MKFLWAITFILYILFMGFATASSHAVSTPTFPSCQNPQGSMKVQYGSGTHGIVGSSLEYKGSDAVYKLADDTLTQCFCSEDNNGIQTNWWKVSSLAESEIQSLKNQGWIFIPNGALWGLEPVAYFAKNETYACKAGAGGGSVLGASTQSVLAATGGTILPYALLLISIAFFMIGFFLKRSGKKKNGIFYLP